MSADVSVDARASSPGGMELAGPVGMELAGLDRLELAGTDRQPRAARIWSAAWPKLVAVALVLAVWQLIVAVHWRPSWVLPGPTGVFSELWREMHTAEFWTAVGNTMRRAVVGFAVAVVVGSLLGAAVSRIKTLRSAVGSLITCLQTMPSIAWFPFAILLFQLSENAILFVVVLGAAPAIANGLISGTDYVPPLMLRAGRMLGARRLRLYRHVILPASLPTYLAGLKQGWAFAWRSLMAGELLVPIAHRASLGLQLQNDQNFNDATGLLATMIVILVIGILVDGLFTAAGSALRRRWGTMENTS